MAGLVSLGTRDKQIIKSLVLKPGFVISQLSEMFSRISGPVHVCKMVNSMLYEEILRTWHTVSIHKFQVSFVLTHKQWV